MYIYGVYMEYNNVSVICVWFLIFYIVGVIVEDLPLFFFFLLPNSNRKICIKLFLFPTVDGNDWDTNVKFEDDSTTSCILGFEMFCIFFLFFIFPFESASNFFICTTVICLLNSKYCTCHKLNILKPLLLLAVTTTLLMSSGKESMLNQQDNWIE